MGVGVGVMNCADNTGDKNLAIMTVKEQDHSDEASRHVCVFREEGQACAQEKVMSVVVICRRKSRHRKESIFINFEDNAGVIVNVK